MIGLGGLENSTYLPFHMRNCSRGEVTCPKVGRGGEQQSLRAELLYLPAIKNLATI